MEIQEAREIIEDAIKSQGYTIHYTAGNYGRVYWKTKQAHVPIAKTRSTLYVLLHEAGHVFHAKTGRTFENEYITEKRAHEYMRMFGFAVPRKSTKRAKKYVAYRVRMSKRRGLKAQVSAEIRNFIK